MINSAFGPRMFRLCRIMGWIRSRSGLVLGKLMPNSYVQRREIRIEPTIPAEMMDRLMIYRVIAILTSTTVAGIRFVVALDLARATPLYCREYRTYIYRKSLTQLSLVYTSKFAQISPSDVILVILR
jgi:hypothetical protein